METKNRTPPDNAIKCAIIELRLEMREHAKLKTLNYKKELNYIYLKLGNIINL